MLASRDDRHPLPPAAINDGPPVTPRPGHRARAPWRQALGAAAHAARARGFGPALTSPRRSRTPRTRTSRTIRPPPCGALMRCTVARKGRRHPATPSAERCARWSGRGATFTRRGVAGGLEPAHDRLVLFARWITPARLFRRCDTLFCLASPVRSCGHTGSKRTAAGAPERAPTTSLTSVYATRAVLESVAVGASSPRRWPAPAAREVPIVELACPDRIGRCGCQVTVESNASSSAGPAAFDAADEEAFAGCGPTAGSSTSTPRTPTRQPARRGGPGKALQSATEIDQSSPTTRSWPAAAPSRRRTGPFKAGRRPGDGWLCTMIFNRVEGGRLIET